jgi:hypothetical protein
VNPWSDLRFVRGALHVSLALACGREVRPPDLAEIEIVRWLADLLRRGSPPELLEEALRQFDAGDSTVETFVRNMSEFALSLTEAPPPENRPGTCEPDLPVLGALAPLEGHHVRRSRVPGEAAPEVEGEAGCRVADRARGGVAAPTHP